MKIQHLECALVTLNFIQTIMTYDLHVLDVDECATNRHNCSDRMDCIDTMGSYVCVCKEGYNVSIGFEDECQGKQSSID